MGVVFALWKIVDVAHVEAVLVLLPGRDPGLEADPTVVTQGHALGTESIEKRIDHHPLVVMRATLVTPDLDRGLYPENLTDTGLRQSLDLESVTGTDLDLARGLRRSLDLRTITGTAR